MTAEVAAKRGRGGRPPADRAGDVEARLLAAATRLFLERGYDGTTCDQVALDAGAGKASIYARYANKGALFTAVIDNMLGRPPGQSEVATETPLRERLQTVGMSVLADALHPDALALLRLVVSEMPRFAGTGVHAEQLFWQAGVQRVAGAIAVREPDHATQAVEPAQQFIELVLMAPLMRALLGEPVAPLIESAPGRIDGAIAALEAAGALANWT
ncbi:TetR/AcrR family transcriptional regulator [Pseudoduganella plicata]|uniref:TetR family transcriptional regulator n=1 Tax=Pseudoduganella plicata TaxID=321984 RepID=A0A4P7BBQ6_9BURK|nr:TetR/AcrR family transcriptional regulator [Pseudoduganella plicata]QBQ35513.1 TetR/AcrR family transcriptional regulator [Pseudoduganella plicata]GGY97286.1 TetR family transcriptional regulator [Pseudoduganella plicata]